MRYPLSTLFLQEVKTNENRAHFQLNTIFPEGNFSIDTTARGRVGAMVALPAGLPLLDSGQKGDSSFAWVKTQTCKGKLYIGSVYGSYKRPRRVALWKWLECNLPVGNWFIYGDFNQTKKVEDSVCPSPVMHGLERHAWNRFSNKFDFLDNCLIALRNLALTSCAGPPMVRDWISLVWIGAIVVTVGDGWNL